MAWRRSLTKHSPASMPDADLGVDANGLENDSRRGRISSAHDWSASLWTVPIDIGPHGDLRGLDRRRDPHLWRHERRARHVNNNVVARASCDARAGRFESSLPGIPDRSTGGRGA